VLARLQKSDDVAAAYLAWDGTRLLVEGEAGTPPKALVAAAEAVLADRGLRPAPQDDALARQEWARRADPSAWVGEHDLWRLSWREAETLAARLTKALVERFGPKARGLEPLLTESFFEGVRPADGSGPTSPHWPQDAPVETRREAILERAAELLDEAALEGLRELLAAPEEVRELISAAPESPAGGGIAVLYVDGMT
jgi:hypothetical protein